MARKRKSYSRRSSGIINNKLLSGIVGGAAATIVRQKVNMPYLDDLTLMAVGYFMKNSTLKTIGAVGLGSDLASGFTGGNGGYI